MRTKSLYLSMLFSLSVLAAVPAQVVLFSDTFTGGSGRPAGWTFDTPEERFWNVQAGWLATGNGDDLADFSFALVEVPGDGGSWVNCRVSCRFWMKQANGSVVLVGRWRDSQNYRRASLDVYQGEAVLRLARVVKGQVEELAAPQKLDLAVLGIPPIQEGNEASAQEFTLAFDGNNVTAGLAGRILARGRDLEPEPGRAGIGQRLNEAYFDDVLVTSVGADVPAPLDIKTVFHLVLASGVSADEAQGLAEKTRVSGNGPVFLRGGAGKISVEQGNYLSRGEADKARSRLEGAGLAVADVSEERRGGAPGKPAVSSEKQTLYRVSLGNWSQVSEATTQVSDLRKQGYFPAVQEESGYQKVYLGPFGTREEALTMQARMVTEGFLLAKVEKVEPGSVLAPVEMAAAATTKDIEGSRVFQSDEWKKMTPAQKEQVIGLVMKQRASREGLVTVEEIADIKQKVAALDKDQKEIVNRIDEETKQETDRQRDMTRFLSQINLKQDQGDLDGAMAILGQLESLAPDSPIVVFKRRSLELAQKDQFEGSHIMDRKEQTKLALMEEQARQLSQGGASGENLQQARLIYLNILGAGPQDEGMKKRAEEAVRSLGQRIQDAEVARKQQDQQQRQKERMLIFGAIGGVGLLFLLILFVGYLAGRRRYARMLQQLQEEAITPLQELKQRTRRIASAGGSGLAFDAGNQGLIEQTESSGAEFMIPETEKETEMEPEPVAVGGDLFDGSGGLGTETFGAESGVSDLTDMSMEDFSTGDSALETPAGSSAQVAAEEEKPAEEEFMMDFAPSAAGERDGSSPPPVPEQAGESGEGDEIVFSFDESEQPPAPSPRAESTGAPITASEVQPSVEEPAEDIVFSFDDTGSGSPPFSAAAPEMSDAIELTLGGEEIPQEVAKTEKVAEDSFYESIPLGDLNLDAELGPLADAEMTASSRTQDDTVGNPLTDSGLDLGFEEVPTASFDEQRTAPSGDTPLAAEPLLAETQPVAGRVMNASAAGGGFFTQDFQGESVGALPRGWSGESTSYATLTVQEDPDGGGDKCLQFDKTSGEGPTSFACAFPDVSGKICIEFDIRCDRKNKHLLGFYIEKDGDFRRSVHTVVQCVDPNSPAHLRVFTRPTPYELKTWRRVKYIVDLADGLVDGYVGNQLVAEGVRMGTKTDSLNTFSIRDNSESTGTLYLKNLVIRPADEEA